MQFCISITNEKALEKWRSIPKQKRSRYVEDMLLREETQDANIEELKNMLMQISLQSVSSISNINIDDGAIDEILNM